MSDMSHTPKPPNRKQDPGDPDDTRQLMREILTDHAIQLDGIFVDMTNYAEEVFADSPYAAQAYLRLAMRAQSGCRSALDAMVRADRFTAKAKDASPAVSADIARAAAAAAAPGLAAKK